VKTSNLIRECIQKFPDWVNNEINNNNRHSLRSNTKGYGGKTHYTDLRNSDTTSHSDRELYHLQFSLQAASPETFGYALVHVTEYPQGSRDLFTWSRYSLKIYRWCKKKSRLGIISWAIPIQFTFSINFRFLSVRMNSDVSQALGNWNLPRAIPCCSPRR
jgi:hypothetical protein